MLHGHTTRIVIHHLGGHSFTIEWLQTAYKFTTEWLQTAYKFTTE